jgi:hypothetical protein
MQKIIYLLFLLGFLPVVSQNTSYEGQPEREVLTQYDNFGEGIPVILVVSVFPEGKEKDTFFAEREFAELQRHFPNYDIRLIDKHSLITFENDAQETANYSDSEDAFELVVFWDGKKNSKIKAEPIKVKLTEYISSLTGEKKVSTYLAENQKIFDDIAKRKLLFNPDKNSKALTQFYIKQMLFNPMVYGQVQFYPLIHQDFTSVKKVTVYARQGEKPERKMFIMTFNDKHLVSGIEYVASDEHGKVTFAFTYDGNGLLRKMVNYDGMAEKPKTTAYAFGYDNGRIIETSEDQITEYSMQNNLLITDRHHEYIDYDKTFRVESLHETIEDSCKVTYEDGKKKKAYCPSGFDSQLPYIYEQNGFKYDQLSRQSKSKIDREGNVLAIYNFNHQDNEYRKAGTITLNEKGVTQSTEGGVQKGLKHVLRFEYEVSK